MKIIDKKISIKELNELAKERFGDMVKAVVDINREIMAIGGELHADEEELLIKNGSDNFDLWGINIYPEKEAPRWIEFNSMINIRPQQNNRTRGVDDLLIREKIVNILNKLVER